MRIVLVRHPQPDVPAGLIYGQLDVPVLPSVQQQALGQWTTELADLPTTLPVWTSPLSRCQSAAEEFCKITGKPAPQTDARLMEVYFGDWEGRTWDSLPAAESEAWMANWLTAAPPGGENVPQLLARVQDWWTERLRDGQDFLLIGHATPIRLILHLAQGQPLERIFDLPVPYVAIIRLTI